MADFEPTDEQLNTVRDMARLSSSAEAASRLGAINAAEWQSVVEDIALWNRLKNKNALIKGDGVDIDKGRDRLEVRNRVRGLFQLPELDENGNEKTCHQALFFGTFSVKKKVIR